MATCPDCKREVETHSGGPGSSRFLNVHGDETGLKTCEGSGEPVKVQ